MGKNKDDKRTMHFEERIIQSSSNIPKDLKNSFKRFVKKLDGAKYTYQGGYKIEIMEIGPHDDNTYSTTFQLIGIVNLNFQFKIRYILNSSNLELGYEPVSKYAINAPKFARRKAEQMVTNSFMPFIVRAFNKAMEQKKPKVEKLEDKDKTKEHKEKKPKVKKPEDKDKSKEYREKKPKDPLKLLKLQFIEGNISEEEYFRKKKILEE